MLLKCLLHAGLNLYHLSLESVRFFCNLLQSRSALAKENLFLRKQLALYLGRQASVLYEECAMLSF